ncbi:MAG TPA: putative toxin-antitoxin system toxin component, PIN family [Daejeonella sp.]|nr:putative toxin-antitoxin system toxin component, PIN family [Daejeonella sp.]
MRKSKPLRLIIDTNLWISLIISRKLNRLDPLLYSHNARLLFSIELIQEIEMTIAKPKLEKYFQNEALSEMLTVFEPFIDLISVKSKVNLCRGPKDDFLLALAKDGKADYLITGDKDLLSIGRFEQTSILTISEFLVKIKG